MAEKECEPLKQCDLDGHEGEPDKAKERKCRRLSSRTIWGLEPTVADEADQKRQHDEQQSQCEHGRQRDKHPKPGVVDLLPSCVEQVTEFREVEEERTIVRRRAEVVSSAANELAPCTLVDILLDLARSIGVRRHDDCEASVRCSAFEATNF